MAYQNLPASRLSIRLIDAFSHLAKLIFCRIVCKHLSGTHTFVDILSSRVGILNSLFLFIPLRNAGYFFVKFPNQKKL